MAGAIVVALLAAHYLPHADAGVAVFAAAALLLLVCALCARSRRRAQDAGDTDVQERAGGRVSERVGRWAGACAGVAAGLGLLVWALGVWVTVAGLCGVIIVLVWYRTSATRRRIIVPPPSSPLDSGSWLDELPGRVADAVDAARLVRGHADESDAYLPEQGEGAQ
jgi:uncharacterized membrane protein